MEIIKNKSVEYINFAYSKYNKYLINIKNEVDNKKRSIPKIFKSPIPCIVAIIGSLIITYFADFLVCTIVGILYPVYRNYQELVKSEIDKEKIIKYNKYWIVISTFFILEKLIRLIFGFVPGYSIIKLVLIYFLVHNDFTIPSKIFTIIYLVLKKYHVSELLLSYINLTEIETYVVGSLKTE
jgi:hypothetical protein